VQCAPWTQGGTGCTNPTGTSIGIACTQIADCVANGATGATVACCLQGATAPADPAGCTYPKSHSGTAVACETTSGTGNAPGTCAAGEVQICSADADCPAGLHCVAGKWKILQVGFCQ
jgi:hypothetical protein